MGEECVAVLCARGCFAGRKLAAFGNETRVRTFPSISEIHDVVVKAVRWME